MKESAGPDGHENENGDEDGRGVVADEVTATDEQVHEHVVQAGDVGG